VAGPALGTPPPLPDVGPHSENAITGQRRLVHEVARRCRVRPNPLPYTWSARWIDAPDEGHALQGSPNGRPKTLRSAPKL
jgi:hypothetical protein